MNQNRMSIHELREIRSNYIKMLLIEIVLFFAGLLMFIDRIQTSNTEDTNEIYVLIFHAILSILLYVLPIVLTVSLILEYSIEIVKSNKDSKKF